MRWVLPLVLVACTPATTRPHPESELKPPVADQRPHAVTSPSGNRNDPYYWIRDDTRKNADRLGYLNAENAYAKQMLAPVASLEKTLYDEMRGHIKEDDTEAPTFDEGYWYYAKFSAGQEHPVYVRRKGAMDAPEEVILDGNALANGHEFFSFGGHAVSH